jgi:sulfotransferase
MAQTQTSKTPYFIAGLPRSGSTLLSAILRQNPRFYAGMTSPVANLFETILAQFAAGSEMSHLIDDGGRQRLLRGIFESFYAAHEEPVVFDTNRAWTANLPVLMALFPETKIICCVRDVAWIMDSMERQFRANAFEQTRLFQSPAERATVYTRVEALAGATRLVGFPWHALREAAYSEFASRLVIVEYDLLAARPKDVMKLLYEFLGETAYVHDFENVSYDAPKFDEGLGLSGLHRVHKTVAPRPRKSILPPDLFERYDKLAFWRDMPGSEAFKVVAKSKTGEAQNAAMPAPTQNVATN